jgi:hypothetical protein
VMVKVFEELAERDHTFLKHSCRIPVGPRKLGQRRDFPSERWSALVARR